MTQLANSVVLVTGANGGLGTEFVRQALGRGAARVYATARSPRSWDDEHVVPLRLDVTDPASIAEAAEIAADTTIVINNAGIAGGKSLLTMPFSEIREVYETNVFGPIAVARAFAPVLGRNGGGALVDIHSALSWLATRGHTRPPRRRCGPRPTRCDSSSALRAPRWSALISGTPTPR
jgi:NAD(P)-dependent dehydrogenase (short-subunit alcohol dehydrogenase family)